MSSENEIKMTTAKEGIGSPKDTPILETSDSADIQASIADKTTIVYVSSAGIADKTQELFSNGRVSNAAKTIDSAELCSELFPRLAMEQNCDEAPEISVIQAALKKDPDMMKKMLSLPHGVETKLCVTHYEPANNGKKGTLVFAESQEHNRVDVAREVALFNSLTHEQKDSAIGRVIQDESERFPQQYVDVNKDTIRTILEKHCYEELSPHEGLNYWQSRVYVAHFGGRLPTYKEDRTSAYMNPQLEDGASSWHHDEAESLLDINVSGIAPEGDRRGGEADRNGGEVDFSDEHRGGRVAGLRVQL